MSEEVVSKVSRKKTRKFLFQRLFSKCYTNIDNAEFTASFLLDKFAWVLDEDYMAEMEVLVVEKESTCIALIQKYSPKFEIEKMSFIYLLPIYIGVCEMMFLKEEIPAKVSINEAVELAKVYWDDSCKKIVNWVLNKVYEDNEKISKELDTLKPKNDFSIFSKN